MSDNVEQRVVRTPASAKFALSSFEDDVAAVVIIGSSGDLRVWLAEAAQQPEMLADVARKIDEAKMIVAKVDCAGEG